ncbi:hypothetical protein [Actinospica robiniae]|uniref:hypothetical protein n=1 Tax=Actinospica robiniae TaxID=304901 RepID=UPI00041D6A63|nr:hypothetical protein [Actinospica robiniae]
MPRDDATYRVAIEGDDLARPIGSSAEPAGLIQLIADLATGEIDRASMNLSPAVLGEGDAQAAVSNLTAYVDSLRVVNPHIGTSPCSATATGLS